MATADIVDVTEVVLSGADYQREFPRPAPAPPPDPPPEWTRDVLEWMSGAGGFAEAALWIFAAGLVIWVGVQLLQLRGPAPRWAGNGPASRPAASHRHAAPVTRSGGKAATLAAADALAAEGRYGEAIHALLLHCVGEIKRRPGTAVSDSLTGREIVRRMTFAGDTRAALHNLVASAEKSHFGGYPAEENDYRTCRRDYQRVAAAMTPA